MSRRSFFSKQEYLSRAHSFKRELPDLDFASFVDGADYLLIVWRAALYVTNRHYALPRLVRMSLLPLGIVIDEPSENIFAAHAEASQQEAQPSVILPAD